MTEVTTQTRTTTPSRTGSTLRLSGGREATSAAYTSVNWDNNVTSMVTASGSASSVSVTARSTVASDSPSLAVSSAEPSSSGPSSSNSSTEPSLSATSQPSKVLTSPIDWTTAGPTSVGRGAVTVLTTNNQKQEHVTAQLEPTSSAKSSPLHSTYLASAVSPGMTHTGLYESPTVAQVSSTTSDTRDETSISLPATSLPAPSMVNTATREVRMETVLTVPYRMGSSIGVSGVSEIKDVSYTSISQDKNETSMVTVNGSAISMSLTSSSAGGSDSHSLAGSSAAPVSSALSSSSSNADPSFSAMSQPSTGFTSPVPVSTAGTTSIGRDTVTVLTQTNLNQEQSTAYLESMSSFTASPLPSRAVASAASPATSHTGLGESPTMAPVSGTMSDAHDKTSISLPCTSLSAASMVTMAAGEARTQTVPTTPSRTGSSLGVYGVSEATTVSYTSISWDNNENSMVTALRTLSMAL
ncbi:uncharacterized serine-rich protein C215.13-like [Oxyura jamaicensis]|uniref:uncharacterized serine-rich protein C215.13-like n=1 Tax=Oxyura jamaicensis TaxID=8884 RepID=UPI0015A6DCD3|nr:uncharacterized serine-rich protein C215.13-like [Oxyura jamaicensis]